MEEWNSFWATATVFLSFIGFVICLFRYFENKGKTTEVARRFQNLFFSLTLFFLVTILFGFFNAIAVDADFILYPARCFIILLFIYYKWELMKPIPPKEADNV